MTTSNSDWEVMTAGKSWWWEAEERDPRKGGTWRTLRSLSAACLMCIPHYFAGTAHVYRLKNLTNGKRKNVYSRYDFKVGSVISKDDWEGEVDESIFKALLD